MFCDVLIVGGGCSGTLTAVHLLRLARGPLSIVLIEKSPVIGCGVAYGTPDAGHLLNVPAARMSALAQDPQHLVRWLDHRGQQGDIEGTFISRKLYGTYLQEVLSDAQAHAELGVTLRCLSDEVIGVSPRAQDVMVQLHSGKILQTKHVVLALGNNSPADPQLQAGTFRDSTRYLPDPWALGALNQVGEGAEVLLIGSGLTMLDVMVSLKSRVQQFHVLSRRGLLPRSHQPHAKYPAFLKSNPHSLRSLVRQIRQHIALAASQGQCWRSVLDALRSHSSELWQGLSLADQQRFMRHVRPYWEVHRHRTAPQVAAVLTELQQAQRLTVHRGRLHSYQDREQQTEVTYHTPSNQEIQTLHVDWVINCTGPQGDYRRIPQPLLKDLFGKGLVRATTLGVGLEVASDGALYGEQGHVSHRLFTLGPPCRGIRGESTAVPEIREQAAHLAQTLLRHLARIPVGEYR